MNITKRGWFRWTILGGAAFIIVMLGAITLWRVRVVMAAESGEGVQPKLAAFEKPEIPDHENAANWLKAGAAAAAIWSPEDGGLIKIRATEPASDWSDEVWLGARAMVRRHGSGLATMHKAAALEQSNYNLRYRDGFDLQLPPLLDLLKAQRMLWVEMTVAAHDGSEDATLLALATASKLAESLESESTLITALIGIAAERILLEGAAELVTSNLSWAHEPEFLTRVEGVIPSEASVAMLQRCLDFWVIVVNTEYGQDVSDPDEPGWRDGMILGEVGDTDSRVPPVELSAEQVAGLKDVFLELTSTPYATAQDRFVLQSEDHATADPVPPAVQGFWRGFITGLARAQLLEANRQLLHAAINVLRIGQEEGGYPAQRPPIRELQIRDPFTGRQLLYETHNDGSVTLALDGADEFAQQITLSNSARVRPITLSPPP